LNLSKSCRDCLRHLGDKWPEEEHGNAVQKRFGQAERRLTKMILLDRFLGIRCATDGDIVNLCKWVQWDQWIRLGVTWGHIYRMM
jgi:hypothetical protein